MTKKKFQAEENDLFWQGINVIWLGNVPQVPLKANDVP